MTSARRKKKARSQKGSDSNCGSLGLHVQEVMEKYFRDMDGHQPNDLYELILSQIEMPLFESVLNYTDGNVSRAAEMLGLNRGTFRNRLTKYDMQ
jgi:Fis family transcriptional regulator, factor for inversion stimulation protein